MKMPIPYSRNMMESGGRWKPVIIIAPVDENSKLLKLQKSLDALQEQLNLLLESQRTLANIHTALLARLEGPVCFGYFIDKQTNMGAKGHNFYVNGNNGMAQGPVGGWSRGEGENNYYLGMPAANTLRSCKYAEEGCFALFPLLSATDLELHEGSCPHRFQCRMFLEDYEDDELAYCQWRGKRREFMAHCIEHHPIIKARKAVLRLPIPLSSIRTYLEITIPFLCQNEKLFLMTFHYHRFASGVRALLPILIFLGKQEDLNKFNATVTFFSRHTNYDIEFTCPPYLMRKDFSTLVTEHPHLDEGMMNIFTKTNVIDCVVEITAVA